MRWIRWLLVRWRFHRLVQALPEDDESIVFLLVNGSSYVAVRLEPKAELELADGWVVRRASPPCGTKIAFEEKDGGHYATAVKERR